MRTLLLALVALACITRAYASIGKVKELTPIYAAQGWMTWGESDAVQIAIGHHEYERIVVPMGATGDNIYYSGRTRKVHVISSYVCPRPREAWVVCGMVFFDSCGNWFRWNPPCEKRIVSPSCKPESEPIPLQVTVTVTVIEKSEPQKPAQPVCTPAPCYPPSMQGGTRQLGAGGMVSGSSYFYWSSAQAPAKEEAVICDPDVSPPPLPPPPAADLGRGDPFWSNTQPPPNFGPTAISP